MAITKIGVKGAESLAKGMDSPLIFKYEFFYFSLSDANGAPYIKHISQI